MKINHKILSIPPYISTSWKNIQTIFINDSTLHVCLINGKEVAIPGLPTPVLEEIFNAHTGSIEKNEDEPLSQERPIEHFSFGLPIGDLQTMGQMMHHNPEQAHAPNMPPEMLAKVVEITEAMGLEAAVEELPPAEPHCNCPYCQLARAIGRERDEEELAAELPEEAVSDEELTFREWDIQQIDAHRYTISNPMNKDETYQVYLGTPVGCTCGQKDCEHIQYVLRH